MLEKVKRLAENCFGGDTIVSKRDLWFIGGICFLAGVVYGMLLAPWTRGVQIGCNNGNGCCCGDFEEDEER